MESEQLFKLAVYIVIAFVLLMTPVIGKYVAVLNTLIHEVGHALVAILTGGKVSKIELFANTEGAAWSSSRFWLGRFLTTLAGYPVASFTAFLFLYFIHHDKYDLVLIILLGVLVISLIFWIRNLYGFFWTISFGAMLAALLVYDNVALTENILLFLTATIFVASITSAFTILKLSFMQPRDCGDASNLTRTTVIIPPQLWGALFFVQSLVFAWFGIQLFM